MWRYSYTNELYHHGVKGMKWGVRRYQNKDGSLTPAGKKRYSDDDVVIEKGTEIHRIIPKTWIDKEKNLSGHAYASYKREDTEQYKKFARMFGDGNNYIDMTFKAKDIIISPSKKRRVDEFIKLMDSDPDARNRMIKATRNPLVFMPKKRLDKLDDPKQAEKAYEKFSYLVVSNKELRDPYFKRLEKAGYSMVIDDADVRGGISKSPIIVFDRNKSLQLKSTKVIGRKETKVSTSDKELQEFRKQKIASAPTKAESPRGANKGWWKNAPKSTIKKYYEKEHKK